MYEILDHLDSNAVVLDIGSGEGSFRAEDYRFRTVRVDVNASRMPQPRFVQADATRLPFRSRTFDAIILNHSVEHFSTLKPTLQEIGRVVKRDGAAFVSVPDARTMTDRVYRKVMKNAGGHVNLFGSSADLERMLAWYFGLPHVATRTLYSGLTFLNRKHLSRDPAIWAQVRFGGFCEPLLAAINASVRLLDRLFRTRLSVYGWAMYFGSVQEAVDIRSIVNVCLRCGNGRLLNEIRGARKTGTRLAEWYVCPECGARNIGISDSPVP